MNKKQLTKLTQEFIQDAKELETNQQFNNVCTIKKLDVNSGDLIPYAMSVNYWQGVDQMTITLVREDLGDYSISLNKKVIKEHVPITQIRKTLESYKFDLQIGMYGNVVQFTFKKKRGKSNVQKKVKNNKGKTTR